MWPFKTRRNPAQQEKIVVVRREHTKLRLQEWQSQAGLVEAARKVWSDSNFRLMVDVLNNESPSNLHLIPTADTNLRASIQAKTEGYNLCLANLEALKEMRKADSFIEATFEPPEPS